MIEDLKNKILEQEKIPDITLSKDQNSNISKKEKYISLYDMFKQKSIDLKAIPPNDFIYYKKEIDCKNEATPTDNIIYKKLSNKRNIFTRNNKF
jgi:hypothetical protein